jgi:uncharacterized protein YggT (Ycf19 family)
MQNTLTALHVLISLAGIATGVVVALGLLRGRRRDGWTAAFLITTVLTSVTGFLFFPFHEVLPSHVVGAVSLVVLALAIYARYPGGMRGAWRRAYVINAMIALYLNVFVLIAQAFLKVPALNSLAPTGAETPFKVAQLAVLTFFVVLGTRAAMKFREDSVRQG